MNLRLKISITFILIMSTFVGLSQNINVRIFSQNKIETFVFYAKSGKYDFVANNKILCSIDEGQSATITQKSHKIYINTNFSSLEA